MSKVTYRPTHSDTKDQVEPIIHPLKQDHCKSIDNEAEDRGAILASIKSAMTKFLLRKINTVSIQP
jgi:hypothetical protein